jgi:D-arginine dehydrogenase
MRTDVLVVGGGIAGASVAWWLAQRAHVVLVERESGYGYHSSGRSAAEWSRVHCQGALRALVEFGKPFFDAPPPGFTVGRLLERRGDLLFTRPGQDAVAAEFAAAARRETPAVAEISVERALEIVPFLRREALARCFYDPDNCEIDVDALHQGFLRGVRAAGSTTQSGVEFQGAERHGGEWRARVGGELIETPRIVNAAGAWADVVAGRAGVAPLGLEPRRRTALTFDPGFDVRRLPPVDDLASGAYFKPAGAALMVCAGDQTPSEPCDAQPEEFDIAVAVDHFETCTTLSIGRLASRWAGLRTFARDEQPVAGPASEAPGFFWVVGQGGSGIMSSPGLGRVAATLVLEEAWPAEAAALGLVPAALSQARLAQAGGGT